MGRLTAWRTGRDRTKSQSCKGTGRYAFEHWIHSHPHDRPCDLYTTINFTWGYDGLPTVLHGDDDDNDDDDAEGIVVDAAADDGTDRMFELKPAPRFDDLATYDTHPEWCAVPTLEARLQEYHELYGGSSGGGKSGGNSGKNGGGNNGTVDKKNIANDDDKILGRPGPDWWGWRMYDKREETNQQQSR